MADVTKKSEYILEIPDGQMGKINVYVDPSTDFGSTVIRRTISTVKKALADEFIPQDEFAAKKGTKRWRFFDLGTRLRVVPTATTSWADMVMELDATNNKINGHIPESQVLEYVELNYVALGHYTDRLYQSGVPSSSENMYEVLNLCNIQVAPDDWNDILAFNQYTLGLHDENAIDPLGFSSYDPNLHDKTRKIPHCLPLWYGPPSQKVGDDYVHTDIRLGEGGTSADGFDIILTDVVTDEVITYPNAEYREIQDDLARVFGVTGSYASYAPFTDVWEAMEKHRNPYWATADENDDPGKVVYTRQNYENWNTFNLSQDGTDISEYGVMNLKDDITETGEAPLTNIYHFGINSRFAYEWFDTADTDNFKVTSEPDYNATAQGPIVVLPTTDLKCYLVPRMYGWAIHLFMYSYCVYNYESYRVFVSGEGHNRYENSILISNGGIGILTGSSGGGVTLSGSPVLGQSSSADPDMVHEGESVSLTISDSDGEYTVSGAISASGTATLVGGSVYNLTINQGDFVLSVSWFKETIPANFASSSYGWTIDMNYTSIANAGTTSASPQVLRGVHVGRFPVIPSGGYGSDIFSCLTWEGPNYKTAPSTWQRTDGTSVDYDPNIAKTYEGRGMLWFPLDFDASGADIHIRNRDPNTILHTDRIFVQYDATQSAFIPQTQGDTNTLLTHSPVSPDTEAPVGSLEAIVQSEAQRIASEQLSVLSGKSYTRNVTQVGGPAEVVVGNQWGSNLYPIDAKAGQLVGVVVTNGAKHYVWRTTDENRGGLDINGRPIILLDLVFSDPIPPYES